MLAVPRIRKSLKELESYRTHGSGSLPDRDMQNPSILAIQRDSKNDSIFGARREMRAPHDAMHRVAWAHQNSKSIGQKCEKPWENQGFAARASES